MATCNLCNERLPEKDMADAVRVMDDHLRVVHPDIYGDGPERWPDGSIVIDASDIAESSDFETKEK